MFSFSRASISVDILVLSLVVVIVLLSASIYVVKVGQRFALHKRLQLICTFILLVSVSIFEVDMRLNGWRHLARPSVYYDSLLWIVFYAHLAFSISATVLWGIVVIAAFRRFAKIPVPNEHSLFHKRYAKLAAALLYGTAISGLTFYYVAFVA